MWGLRYDHFKYLLPHAKQQPNENVSSLFPVQTYAASGNLVDWNTVSPRVGLAFDVTGKGTSVLRLNYGGTTSCKGPG